MTPRGIPDRTCLWRPCGHNKNNNCNNPNFYKKQIDECRRNLRQWYGRIA